MTELAPKLTMMAQAAAQAAVPARPPLHRGGRDRALIDAALAVNESDDLEHALGILARAGRDLLGADRVSVVVWDQALERGLVRAATGAGDDIAGVVLRPGRNGAYRAAVSGEPLITRSIVTDGIDARLASALAHLAACVEVPISAEGAPPVTFGAGWLHDVGDEDLLAAIETLGALGTLTRVAYRSHGERLKAHERARFEAVLNSVADGTVVRTQDGIVLNSTARRLLELDGAVPLEPPRPSGDPETEDRALTPSELVALLAVDLAEERHFRYRVALPSGREAFLAGSVAPIVEPAGRSGSVAVFRDVTVEHNREFLTEQLLERLFDALPLAIAVAEPTEREVLSVNAAFLSLIGYTEEEVIGCRPPYPWLEVAGDAARMAALPPDLPVETLFRDKEERLIPVEIKRLHIPGPDGAPAAIVGLIVDRSEQRRFEQQLAQSGKLATIGELAAGVAHEINNPLFAILGLVEFLLKEAEPGTKAHDRLLLVQQTGLEIKEIVRALLDFAREPSQERAVIDVSDAAHEIVELIRRTSSAKAIELVERYSDDPAPVVGSPNQLKQVFLNLVTNASQALAGEGTIEIAVRRDGDWVEATVSDNGDGIPDESLGRIFEPFFTTKRDRGGSGLGLSVSHGIAAAHGGSLVAENLTEGGACFTLRLPVKETM